MTAKTRNRDMWKAIPWERRAEIRKQIQKMPECRNKEILRLAFIENLSTADIAERAKTDMRLYSRNHKPISKRRVLQIISEYVPDYNAYQDHSGKTGLHKDHGKYHWSHKKERCASCGATESLEWHHMIPAFLGGTAEEQNMICLCKDCHRTVTEYHRKLYPDFFKSKSARQEQEPQKA